MPATRSISPSPASPIGGAFARTSHACSSKLAGQSRKASLETPLVRLNTGRPCLGRRLNPPTG
eukprot:2820215-Pyramimonas_sp.AAC.1